MAERPPAPVPEVAGRAALLSTKLRPPGPRPDFLPRPRLAERLDEALGRGLVLVCAPAGYGKTSLLASWARHCPQPVAWLSLDASDNDPARFWRHAVAALDAVCPGIGERVGPLLGPPVPQSFEGLVTALINELAERSGPSDVPLVLDDYHLVGSPPVHASVGFLLDHLPPGLHPVLASRADPPLALARLRARGQLTELRDAELRFTAEEAAAFLRETAGADLPDAAVAALAARTEGWAAGLQLAALSLRGQPDVDRFVAAFTGSHRFVLDYLTEEVLEQQSEQTRAFLLETSVLQRLTGPLCDAVTGQTGSQALLEQVERAGLFLLPLDEVRGWWRYHQLFADLLRARLESQPDRAVQLHRNAAAWYADHELADDAIGHAVAAGEMAWAARLVEENFDERFYLHGEVSTVRRWLAVLPPALAGSRARLLVARARLALLDGDLEEAEGLLDSAEWASADADQGFEPSAGRASSLLVNVTAAVTLLRVYLAELRGDAEATVDLVSRAMAATRAGEAMLGAIIGWYAGMAEWLRGRPAEAERLLSSAVGERSAVGEGFIAAWICHVLCQAQRAQGRLDAVVRTCRRTLEITAPPGRPVALAAGAAHVNLGVDAYQRNELDTALRHVTAGIALCRQLAYTAPLAAGLVTLAWIRQASGDQAGALDAIGEAGRFASGPAVNGLLNPVPAERARLLLAQGDPAGAAGWADEKGLDAGDEPRYPSEPEHLLLARVLLAQDRPGPALGLLDRLYASAVAQDRIGSVIEAGALRALALAGSGQKADAVTALGGVLTLAAPRGYVRVFADEGPPMAALLGQLIAAQRTGRAGNEIPIGYLARLNRAFDAVPVRSGPGRGSTPTAPGIVEPLTSRELEVLQMLAAGQSNQAIAGQFVVTLDTVKKHVSHLLGKLGAANRTEAVARARELGLIT
jgi:LuxR family transcriptional regulator, maltose regulon positive regulatory protein